jgi:lipid A 3-O-deacylase
MVPSDSAASEIKIFAQPAGRSRPFSGRSLALAEVGPCPEADPQPSWREPLFMPHCGHRPNQCAGLSGKPTVGDAAARLWLTPDDSRAVGEKALVLRLHKGILSDRIDVAVRLVLCTHVSRGKETTDLTGRDLKLRTYLRRSAGVLASIALIGRTSAAPLAQGPSNPAEPGLELLLDEPSYLDFGVGVFNNQGHNHSPATPEARVEFRYGEKLLYFGPAAGLLVNTRGGVYGYAGIYADVAWGRFILTPFGGLGLYSRGSGEDLGGAFQFRLSANLAYEFDGGSRLGAQFAHISNAGIHAMNPGDDELLLTFALPLPF